MAPQDPGFVFDKGSGLYFHARSGFYHDPDAGWYYNTNDGVYYKFEQGTYIPFAAEVKSGHDLSDIEIPNEQCLRSDSRSLDEEELKLESGQSGLPFISAGDCDEVAIASGSLDKGNGPQGDLVMKTTVDPEFKILEAGFPLWYYDSIRSVYWYYDKESRAYYRYHEEAHNLLKGTVESVELKSINSEGEEQIHAQESRPSLYTVQRNENGGALGPLKQSDASQGETLNENGVSLDVGFPLWHYDSLRCTYWYYDKESGAYYRYHEEDQKLLEETAMDRQNSSDSELFQQSYIRESCGNGSAGASVQAAKVLGMQETSQHGEDVDDFRPSTGWVEEALIDLYLKGYPCEATENDNGPWVTSADIFSESSPEASSHVQLRQSESAINNVHSWVGTDKLSRARFSPDIDGMQVSLDDSDNEGSEELEEGEWVPDEPLRIVDESMFVKEGQTSRGLGDNLDKEMCVSIPSRREQEGDNSSFNEELEEGEVEIREIEWDNGEAWNHLEGDSQRKQEEQWQAQFGQVVREKSRVCVLPGAVDLWDWMVVEMESKTLEQGRPVKKLVGRIASSVTKLVSASSGLIRTSAIRATELDFVKVSSGKIYRLRRPSIKHLTSPGTYDSSNPTKDWGFPVLGLAGLDTSENASLDTGLGAHDATGSRTHCLLSKPFVPNIGHWQFQSLVSANSKKGRGVPAALIKYKYLSPEEILMHEQRKQKYRDRAAERRTLHGGFGTGPGQKGLTPREQEILDADNAVEMEGALQTAATALPLGRDNVGKRMLEGMGWKEGQTLGMEGGLTTPLQAHGNDGRAGLGWR